MDVFIFFVKKVYRKSKMEEGMIDRSISTSTNERIAIILQLQWQKSIRVRPIPSRKMSSRDQT
jgi:hypothetical protein